MGLDAGRSVDLLVKLVVRLAVGTPSFFSPSLLVLSSFSSFLSPSFPSPLSSLLWMK